MIIEFIDGSSLELPKTYSVKVHSDRIFEITSNIDEPRYAIPYEQVKMIIY